MSNKDDNVIAGYRFANEKDAKEAKAEVLKIQKIEDKLDYRNPHTILMVYKKIIESKILKTPVGYEYLKKLQTILIESPLIKEEIEPIYVEPFVTKKEMKKTEAPKVIIDPTTEKIKRISIIANIVLLVLVIGMFVISTTSNNPTIINYENTIQNKYATWEQELKEREAVVREKERKLLIED